MSENMDLQISITGQNDTGSSFNSLDSAMSELQKLAEDISKSFSDFARSISSSFTDAGRTVEEMVQPLQEVGSEAVHAGQSIEEMMRSLFDTQADTAAEELARHIAEIGTQAQESTRQIENMEQAADHANSTSAGRGNAGHGAGGHNNGGLFGMDMQMNSMYAGMTMGAAALPLVGAIKASTDAYGQFSQAMANVNSMMGLSQPKLTAMSNQVLELSKNVPDGPVALANALYGIVGAGVPAADQMAVLATASKAATAGQTDVSTATNALIAVMNSYGLKGKDVAAISDQMFAANAAGAMTFTQFANSIGSVAGPAAQAGVSFKEVGAATAALTNQGMSAQRATQGLRALLVGIMSPTAGATKEAKKLGIEWDQNALKSKGMANMLKEAMTATHGNSQELKKLIPNIAAWTVAVDLGGKGADSFKQAMQTMAGSAGATDKAMEEQKQGFTEQMNEMKNSLQSAEIAFAKGFIPVLTDVTGKLAKVAEWFSNLSPSTQKLIGEVTLGAAAFLTLGSAFFMTLSGIGALVSGLKGLSTALAFTKVAEDGTKSLTMLGRAMTFVGGPWGILIAAVVTGVVLLITHWNQVSTWVQQHFGISLPGILTSLTNTFKKVWSSIRNAVESAWNYIEPTIIKGVDTIKSWWNKYWPEMQTAFTNVMKAIVAVASPTILELTAVISAGIGFIKGAWQDGWKAIVDILKMAWDLIKGAVQSSWDVISGIISVALDLLSGHFKKAGQDFLNIFVNLGSTLKSTFSSLGQDAFNFGVNFVNMLGNGIKSAVGSVTSAVSSVASQIKSFLGFHSPAETGPAGRGESDVWMKNMLQMFASDIEKNSPLVQNAIGKVALGIKTGITSPLTQNISQSMAVPSGAGGGGQLTINVYANGNITRNERELGDIVSRAILNKVKMQGRV